MNCDVQDLSSLTLPAWVSALGGRAAVPAGGALSLVTLAGAAALAGKMARVSGRGDAAFEGLSRLFLLAATEDGATYAAVRRGGAAGALRCLEAGLGHLETALEFLERLGESFDHLPPGLEADVAAAGRLARAATQTLLVNLAVNAAEWEPLLGRQEEEGVADRLADLNTRLEAL